MPDRRAPRHGARNRARRYRRRPMNKIVHTEAPISYTPQPVFIPQTIDAERAAPDGLSDAARAQCDRKTLFYDLAPSSDPDVIVCVGPPFLNLGAPLAIAAQGRPVDFAVEEPRRDKRTSTTRIRLGNHGSAPAVHLRFSFREFHVETIYSPVSPVPLLRRVDLTLAAIQKNNDVQWIRDWCAWHHRAHDVERIFIYDNGSENIDDVSRTLAAVSGPELVLVRWNYPYGPPGIFPYNFAQTGFLNHCRLVFGGATAWCINLDVDEYLYSSSGDPLLCYLRDRRYRRRQNFFIRSYVVPMTTDVEPRRCCDSPWRFRAVNDRARKYVYRPHGAQFNGVHKLVTRPRHSAVSRDERSASAFITLAKSSRIGRFLLRTAIRAVRLFRNAAVGLGLRRKKGVLFFFHFRGLNTGWKHQRKVVHPEFRELVEDHRITAMKAVLEESRGAGG